MNMNRRGGAMTAVVAVLAIALVGLGAWYLVSEVFRTKVNSQLDQMTKWTPEQIAKDPVMYLNFCEEQTKKAIEQLKADRISVAQNKGLLEDMRDKAANKVRVGDQKLGELKSAFEKGEKDTSWPVSFDGQSRDKDWVKTNVVTLYKQVETQRHIVDKAETGLKKLEAQSAKINKAEGDASAQLAEIAANRELLKVQKLTDDLKDRLVTMKGTLEGVFNTASDAGHTISLDQLTAESQTTVDTGEFDKVLGKIK